MVRAYERLICRMALGYLVWVRLICRMPRFKFTVQRNVLTQILEQTVRLYVGVTMATGSPHEQKCFAFGL
eukprot:SAG31_NODE_1093_length_9952_cov_16.099056_11_plen_70_part_00